MQTLVGKNLPEMTFLQMNVKLALFYCIGCWMYRSRSETKSGA